MTPPGDSDVSELLSDDLRVTGGWLACGGDVGWRGMCLLAEKRQSHILADIMVKIC